MAQWYGVGLASADRLPVVRIPAGPPESLKCDPPKGNGRRPQKNLGDCLSCFLLLRSFVVFAQVGGFHLNDCIEHSAPCWRPLPL